MQLLNHKRLEMSFKNLEYQPSCEELWQLREWIKKTPYIIQDYNDEFLSAIVRICKGSLQSTKTVLENLNSLGVRYPDYFGHLDVFHRKTQEHLIAERIFIMPKPMDDGTLICIAAINFENTDPYKFHIREGHRFALMSIYVSIWENILGSGKIQVIFDWSNVSSVHARELTPMFLKKSAEIITENYPLRIQAIHHVNVPSILEWAINIIMSFVKKSKILQRIHVHKSMKNLHEFIPSKYLPKDYGGSEDDLGSLHSRWKKKVESYRERLSAENDKMRSLDRLRPKTMDFHDMAGTFTALSVD